MGNHLVSVIMSTFNETQNELESSISSILEQTYKYIEFIIINDNPQNKQLEEFLTRIHDPRVRILKNLENIGLVKSLNKAIEYSTGEYIARMDADDISIPERIEHQLQYINEYQLDIVGSDINLINEKGDIICPCVHFPINDKEIRKEIRYGNCIPHPTWMVRRKVYKKLNGYRDVQSCEDYDFILRVISSGRYQLGNMPEIGLSYRIRQNGVSKQASTSQYILRDYLSKNRKRITSITEEQIIRYMASSDFQDDIRKLETYKRDKKALIEKHKIMKIINILLNKYFYKMQIEKIHNKKRYI